LHLRFSCHKFNTFLKIHAPGFRLEPTNRIIAFSLWIDFHYLKNSDSKAFNFIFPKPKKKKWKFKKKYSIAENEFPIISEMTEPYPLSLYLVAIAVNKCHRRKGLASNMVKKRLPISS